MENNDQIKERGNILVSICCTTYNHEKYIHKCLEGFFIQKVRFNYEILIHDDASTDRTVEIIQEFERKYPNKIKLLAQTENQFSKGNKQMQSLFNFPRASGKYLALCEGDDYWTDEYKLQKQVTFLEANPDFSLCFHEVNIETKEDSLQKHCKKDQDFIIERKDLYGSNIVPTCSALFRNIDFPDPKEKKGLMFGDWLLHLYALGNGKGKYLKDSMGVYRIHDAGFWSTQKREKQFEHIIKVLDYIGIALVETEAEKQCFKDSVENYYLGLFSMLVKQKAYKKASQTLMELVKRVGFKNTFGAFSNKILTRVIPQQ